MYNVKKIHQTFLGVNARKGNSTDFPYNITLANSCFKVLTGFFLSFLNLHSIGEHA